MFLSGRFFFADIDCDYKASTTISNAADSAVTSAKEIVYLSPFIGSSCEQEVVDNFVPGVNWSRDVRDGIPTFYEGRGRYLLTFFPGKGRIPSISSPQSTQ